MHRPGNRTGGWRPGSNCLEIMSADYMREIFAICPKIVSWQYLFCKPLVCKGRPVPKTEHPVKGHWVSDYGEYYAHCAQTQKTKAARGPSGNRESGQLSSEEPKGPVTAMLSPCEAS